MHKKRISRVISMLLAAAMLLSFQGLTVSATQNRDSYFSKNYTLTGNIRDDIVAVAAAQNGKTKAQLGFTEAWCANFGTRRGNTFATGCFFRPSAAAE